MKACMRPSCMHFYFLVCTYTLNCKKMCRHVHVCVVNIWRHIHVCVAFVFVHVCMRACVHKLPTMRAHINCLSTYTCVLFCCLCMCECVHVRTYEQTRTHKTHARCTHSSSRRLLYYTKGPCMIRMMIYVFFSSLFTEKK